MSLNWDDPIASVRPSQSLNEEPAAPPSVVEGSLRSLGGEAASPAAVPS